MGVDDPELAAVNAFLDAFESNEGIESGSTPLKTASDGARNEDGPLDWRVPGYSTMLLRRKRAELQELRDQAADLGIRVLALKQKQKKRGQRGKKIVSSNETKKDSLARFEAVASSERVARQHAEKINRQLRARLKRMERLREEILRVVERYLHQDGEFERIETPVKTLASIGFDDAQHTLDVMIAQVNSVLATSTLHPLNVCGSSKLTSSKLPNGHELRSTVAATCSVPTAAWLLWGRPPRDYPPPLINHETADGSVYRREMIMPLHGRHLPQLDLYVQHFGRRVHDPQTGQVVLVVLALIRVPSISNEVLLCEQFWTRISPTSDLGAGGSITHACYQVRSGSVCGGAEPSSERSELQNRIKHSLVTLNRQNSVIMENWLLEGTAVGLSFLSDE